MVWAILAVLGVPLWLCTLGILSLVVRNRSLRKRPGDVAVRVRSAPGKRWRRGHGVWVHDVFVFRGSPAAWKEELIWVNALSTRAAEPEQPRGPTGLHRIGGDPLIASLVSNEGRIVEFAARHGDRTLIEGPFALSPAGSEPRNTTAQPVPLR